MPEEQGGGPAAGTGLVHGDPVKVERPLGEGDGPEADVAYQRVVFIHRRVYPVVSFRMGNGLVEHFERYLDFHGVEGAALHKDRVDPRSVEAAKGSNAETMVGKW